MFHTHTQRMTNLLLSISPSSAFWKVDEMIAVTQVHSQDFLVLLISSRTVFLFVIVVSRFPTNRKR